MSQLAINGGNKIREKAWPKWPIIGESELEQMTATIKSGIWGYNGPQERKFAREFAEYIGTQYAIPVANGTVSLQIALEALGIGFGDEVIVPGLTWQATASACLDVNAIPILVDVEPESWCIDADKSEEAMTERTKAIIIVQPMRREPGVELQSYFNFVFRYDQNAFRGLAVQQFRAALSAELGCEVKPCYEPLNNCQLYRPLTKNRYSMFKVFLSSP